MKSAYMELLLGDYESEKDFSSFETSVEEHFELLDSAKGIVDNLEQIPESSAVMSQPVSADKEEEIEIKTIPEILKMINDRCVTLNIDAQSLKEKVNILREQDADFISKIEELCEQQLVSLNDII